MWQGLRGVGSELSVFGYAAPVDLTWAFGVLDAGEEKADVLFLGDGSHCQLMCLLV